MKKTARKKVVHKKTHSVRVSSSQKGGSKILPIIIVLTLVAGAGALYVFGQKLGIAIPGMRPPLNAVCKYNDPDLCKFLNNWPTQTNYAVVTSGKYGANTIESTFETSGQDTFHSVAKQDGKEISNTISIGDTTYTLDYADNKWWKQTYKPEEVKQTEEERTNGKFDAKEAEDTSSFKFVVKEACGNLMCFKYEATDTASPDSKQFMWFDDRDYLLRKMRVEDKENGGMDAVYTYDNVHIVAPSPVKEGMPGAGGGVNQQEVQKMMQQYQQQPQQTEEVPTDSPADTSSDTPSEDN